MKTKLKTKLKTKFLPLDDYRNAKWWVNSKEEKITWYTKKGDDYWLIPGSEFPEKKVNIKTGLDHKINFIFTTLPKTLFKGRK